MTNGLSVALLLSLLATDPGPVNGRTASITSILAGLPMFQDIDELGLPPRRGEEQKWGIREAQGHNFRLSIQFDAIYIHTSDITDDANTDKWNEIWRTGLGGGLGLAYQIMPIFRFGGGISYLGFHGTKVRNRPVTVDYKDMHIVPVHVEAALSLPLELPIAAWFAPGKGYTSGPAPYVHVDFGWAWRRKVEAETETSGSGSTDLEIFKQSLRSFFGIRVGLEFRTERVGFFFDFGYRVFERPPEDDDLVGSALEMHTSPIQAGFAYYFGG